jgi:hypothetical protein
MACHTSVSCHNSGDEGDTPGGGVLACLTPAVMPALHTVKLVYFDFDSETSMQQVAAALQQGALIDVEVREANLCTTT